MVLRAAGGWAWNVLNIILLNVLHEGAPSHLQGRVIGFTRSGQDICFIVFTALAGTAATLIGTAGALVTGGVLGVLASVALALTAHPFDWTPARRKAAVR
ncbi:MFS transporter [Amycolatopsis orientalis]|uniref:MFS transporter n=1 Tax=Amycolatopsis orientalis TaxID=31958 RepID=UPI001378D0BE|nr:MFS transporter [Amycolatopsis orientalis]